jgi:hypothetical protein
VFLLVVLVALTLAAVVAVRVACQLLAVTVALVLW